MKIKNIFFALFIIQFLNSCTMAVTSKFWEKPLTGGRIEAFFLDKESKRVVLVGTKNPETNLGMNYSITDKTGQIFKVFEIGIKSEKGVFVYLDGALVRGSKIASNMGWVAFGMNNLSKEDKEFLNEFNVSPGKKKYGHFGYYFARGGIAKIVRYPSSKEKFTNICSESNKDPNCSSIIKLARPWQGSMESAETWSSFFGKLSLTPITMAADVLLTPINAVILIMENRPHRNFGSN